MIQAMGLTALMTKCDIKSAARLLPIHPEDFNLLGFNFWVGVLLWKALPMSLAAFEHFRTFRVPVCGYSGGRTGAMKLGSHMGRSRDNQAPDIPWAVPYSRSSGDLGELSFRIQQCTFCATTRRWFIPLMPNRHDHQELWGWCTALCCNACSLTTISWQGMFLG